MRLGFGVTGPLGERWFDARRARRLVDQAIAAGVRRFDTAPFHGDGEAERRLGAALASAGDEILVSSKTGTKRRGGRSEKDFSPEGMERDAIESARRLGREQLDLLLLHGPSPAQVREAAPHLATLKTQGLAAKVGVCGDASAIEAAIADKSYDAVMGAYNVFEQDCAPAFRRAKSAGMEVLTIAPLAQGVYAADFHRVRRPSDIWRLVRALIRRRDEVAGGARIRAALETIDGLSAPQAALAFALAESSIDAAFTTTTRPAHLAESLAVVDRQLSIEEVRLLNRAITAP